MSQRGSGETAGDLTLLRALQDSERRYRMLIETSPNGIIVHRDDRFLYANPAALALYGAGSLDQLQQHGVLELLHADDRERIAERVQRVQGGDTTPLREVRVVRLDGQEVFVEASAGPADFHGQPAVQVVLRDVTERQRAAIALRQSEERYRLLFETMLQGVVHQGADGTIISMNPAAERILGKTREEFLGSSSVNEEWHTLREDGSRFPGMEHPAMVALRTGEAQRDVVMGVFNPREGRYRWIRIDAVPLVRAGDTAPYQVYTLFHDITEQREEDEARRQAEAAVHNALEAERRARAEAEAANRLKDDFLSTVSHELRTPLSAIIGWALLLEKETLTAGEQARARDAIARNARRQAQLVNDLLDVSRIMAGKLRLEMADVNPEPLVRAAVDAVAPIADARAIDLRLLFDSGGALVHGDATRLQQIAWNLLSNAVKFTPEGGVIHVSLARRDDQLEFRVRDTGVGIDPAFLPHVFERFRQADNTTTRSSGGLGLGLAIVRQLAELHGGTVAAHSEGPGRGATFVVTLPISRDASAHSSVDAAPDDEGVADLPRLQGVSVLVVDDEVDAREVVAAALKRYGARVTVASSVAEALDRLRKSAPEILVADIGMPGEDGYSLMRKVRDLEEGGRRVRAIALTAYARAEDAARALDAGFDLHLAKPVEPTALARAILSIA